MYLIELFLPLYDNQKKPFSQDLFDQLRNELADRFGGVTAFRRSPAEGVWKSENGVDYDEIVVYEVMVEQLEREWWAAYRQNLEQRFLQEEMVLRAVRIERL